MLFNPELHGEWARQRIERGLETAEPCSASPGSPPRPSARRSDTSSSGSVPGSRRSPHSSRSGPVEDRADSPTWRSLR